MSNLVRIIAFVLLALPLPAVASTTTTLYRGDMELITVSGSGCTEKDTSGSRLALELTIKQSGTAQGTEINGYFKGPDLQIGRFYGASLDRMQVVYPDAPGSPQGNTLTLQIKPGGVVGELREKPKSDTGDCYFEKATVTMKQEAAGSEAETAYLHQADLFSAEVSYISGQALLQADKPKEAMRDLAKSLSLRQKVNPNDPDRVYPAVSLAIAQVMDGQETKALAVLRGLLGDPSQSAAAVVKQRTAVSVSLCGGQQSLQSDTGQKASRRLMDLMARDFGSLDGVAIPLAACYNEIGKVHKEQDDPESAIELFQQALKLNPGNPESIAGITMCYVDMETPAEGRKYLSEHAKMFIANAGKESYNDFMSYLYAAEAQQAEYDGEFARAEELSRDAIKAKPGDRATIIQLTRILGKEGNGKEAKRLLEEGKKSCKDEPCRQDYTDEVARQDLIERMVKRLETHSGAH